MFFIEAQESNEYQGKVQLGQDSHRSKVKETKGIVGSLNVVGDLMWPIIFFLKISGQSPLSYEKSEEPMNRQYKIKIKSAVFLWSSFFAIAILYSWVDYVQMFFSNVTVIPSPKNETNHSDPLSLSNETEDKINISWGGSNSQYSPSSITVTIMTAMIVMMTVIQILELAFAWLESAPLARFLNSWAPLQKEFEAIFPHSSVMSPRIKKLRNYLLLFYVAIPSAVFVPGYSYFNGILNQLWPRFLVMLPHAWQLCCLSLMEDVKVMMINRTLAEAFSKIREGIVYSLKWEKPSLKKIQDWRRLAYSVRCQVSEAGEAQKSHQLLLIGGAILQNTSSVFMLLHSPWTGEKVGLVTFSGLLFIGFQVARLYSKILSANRITYEENLIAEELVLMDVRGEDTGIQLEIAFFHNMIVQNPAVINFGNYVHLNKQLLLGVAGQIVTYLIVLMQFEN